MFLQHQINLGFSPSLISISNMSFVWDKPNKNQTLMDSSTFVTSYVNQSHVINFSFIFVNLFIL